MKLLKPQALFLDRDGTLIEWVHYISDPKDVRLIRGAREALLLAKENGCRLFLHTNQSGVGRGYFGIEAVDAVNARMYELMGVDSDFFDGVCIATEVPAEASANSYRKPNPRFEREMIAKYGLDVGRCYFVGDSESDVEAGLNAGMKSVWVLGKTEGRDLSNRCSAGGVLLYDSLREFLCSW